MRCVRQGTDVREQRQPRNEQDQAAVAPNLQAVKVDDRGTHKTARVCTNCLRSKRVKRVGAA